jgi:hypothetical protein
MDQRRIAAEIAARRADGPFMERLRRLISESREVLDRLALK